MTYETFTVFVAGMAVGFALALMRPAIRGLMRRVIPGLKPWEALELELKYFDPWWRVEYKGYQTSILEDIDGIFRFKLFVWRPDKEKRIVGDVFGGKGYDHRRAAVRFAYEAIERDLYLLGRSEVDEEA